MGALLSKVAGVVIVCRTLSRLLRNVAFSSSCGETFSSAADSRQLEAELISKCLPLQRSLRKLSNQRRDEATGSFAETKRTTGDRDLAASQVERPHVRQGRAAAKFLRIINGEQGGKSH